MSFKVVVNKDVPREELYITMVKQIDALIQGEYNLIANLANVAAVMHDTFGFLWTGFYMVDSPEQLILGPFQGPVACTRINYGKGVCGTAWATKLTQNVPDVNDFPGHISCCGLSNSEIVIPAIKPNGEVAFVFDIDSKTFNNFTDVDKEFLEQIVATLVNHHFE